MIKEALVRVAGAALLTKILSIEGIGLLHQAMGGKKQPLGKTTFLYAENGRGKSTLATVLASCTTRDSDLIEDRVTVGSDIKPAAKLIFGDAVSEYKNGSWSGYTPEILVYDSRFVHLNVHTGHEVTSNQRANLLSFALGASAVKARDAEQMATLAEKTANEQARQTRQELEALLGGKMPVPQFRALVDDSGVDLKISQNEQRLADVARSVEIKRQAMPQRYENPDLDLDKIFAVLNETLASVHAKAAAKVADHIAHLNDANSVPWIQRGLAIAADSTCPFCGQDTSAVELLEMYRTYFDSSFTELQRSAEDTAADALSQLSLSRLHGVIETRARNNDALAQWAEYAPVAQLDGSGDELAQASLINLRDMLESLFARKSAGVTDAVGSVDELEEAKRLWSQFVNVYNDENVVIDAYCEVIDDYKKTLSEVDVEQIRNKLERHRMVKLRYSPPTVALVEKMERAEQELKDAEKLKKGTRDSLNALMQETLSRFKDTINEHLRSFNADFQIAEFSHNYRGSTPRMEYRIQLRGEAIELNGGRPTFATALSEGDKKTMGFAFFAASTLSDPHLADKIVVIDDPMSSLDAPRREHTASVIGQIAARSKQLILLAHDEHFLRNTRDRLEKSGDSIRVTEMSLRMTTGNYSDIFEADLDALCQSDYLRNYKLVSGVVTGAINAPDQVTSGAIALRLLLEGYLHRKYPEVIPTGITLGAAITKIEESAGTSSPCAAMSSRVDELREMNDYASRFHHETQPDYATAQRAEHIEVASNGARILDFIHSA